MLRIAMLLRLMWRIGLLVEAGGEDRAVWLRLMLIIALLVEAFRENSAVS